MADLFILCAIALGVSIPLTAMTMIYRLKMARIHQGESNKRLSTQTEQRLEFELNELRQIVHQQAIVVDDLSSMHRRLLEKATEDQSIRNRIGTN